MSALDAATAQTECPVCAPLDQAGDRGLAIVTAESCTGGLLASLLTDVERLPKKRR